MFLFSSCLNSIFLIVQTTDGTGLIFFLFTKVDLHPISSRKRPEKRVDVIRSTLVSFGAAKKSLELHSTSLLGRASARTGVDWEPGILSV